MNVFGQGERVFFRPAFFVIDCGGVMGAEHFLNTLYHDKPDKDFILVWEKRKDKKVSYWFDHTSDAINHFKKQGLSQDTYVGCGTSGKALPAFRRCLATEISGIPGAWIDVDVLNPVHSKPNLPETKQKALEIIEPFPLKPTIIVWSGHGYQFWWVFKKFCALTNQRQHEEAADMLHQFTWTMRDCARSMGYDLDMTFDLSRVFRIPGGKNHKDDPAVPITLDACGENFYTPDEFMMALKTFRLGLGSDATPIDARKKVVVAPSGVVQGAKFKLDPMAEPPQDKLEAMIEFDPVFLASWEHRRKDFKKGESASEYDLSLASLATAAAWEDQEIVDLLIAFRRNHDLPTKLVEKYYERTLRTASNATKDQQVFDELEEIICSGALTHGDPAKTPEENKANMVLAIAKAKELLQKAFNGTIVKRIVQFNIDPFEYKLETDKTCIHLGTVQNLIDQSYFRRKFADATRIYLHKMKESKWQVIAQAMLDICEEESAGDDTSSKGQIRHWFREFLMQYDPLYDPTEAMISRRPFYMKDSLYFFGPDLRKYIARFWSEVINPKIMGIMLKNYGFMPLPMNIKKPDGKYASRSVWKIEIAKDKIAQEFVNRELLNNANRIAAAFALEDEEREAIRCAATPQEGGSAAFPQ